MQAVIDYILFLSCVFLLLGSIFLTFKMRFIQIRIFPLLFQMLRKPLASSRKEGKHTISPTKALLTAISTTLGISTIIGPVIAIHLGGPGALLGFLLTSFFGSAATYVEVNLALEHRKTLPHGQVMGGAMQYLARIFSPFAAKWYAACCLILMMAWSGTQANQLAAILDSPLLGHFRISTYISGALIAFLSFFMLMGGIKRIGKFSAKLVPLMFFLYLGSCCWIILSNLGELGRIFQEMFQAALFPRQMASGALIGGLVSTLRWGIFKGVQANEAGIGTQAIPHSMAETEDPRAQGALAMLSTYAAGIVSFLSGCVGLITKTWQDPSLPLGITMVAASFRQYFSFFGVVIVAVSAILFGFGTILGNSYNGSQCFNYLTENRKSRIYLMAIAAMVFLGAVADVKTIWSMTDIVLAAMAVPHMAALLVHSVRSPILSFSSRNVP